MLRKRGRYWHYEFEVHGVRYNGTTKETVKTRAEMFEALKRAEVHQSGGNVGLRKAPLLREFSKRFLEYYQKRKLAGSCDADTERCYRNGWRLLESTDVADMRMDRIRTTDAAVLEFPGGPSNANQALRTLRRMLSYANELGILYSVPKIKLRREYGREATIDPQTEALLLHLAPDPLKDVLLIMLDAGMRPEEVLRMRWEHIDWNQQRILVPYGKTFRSRRYVPLSNRMAARLNTRSKSHEWIFPAANPHNGKSISKTGHRVSVTKQWLETVDKANKVTWGRGLPQVPVGLVLYSARHTFATRYLEDGGDTASLMKLLGHNSLTTTQKYLHPETKHAAVIINRRNSRAFQLPDELSHDEPNPDAEASSSLVERFDGLGIG